MMSFLYRQHLFFFRYIELNYKFYFFMMEKKTRCMKKKKSSLELTRFGKVYNALSYKKKNNNNKH